MANAEGQAARQAARHARPRANQAEHSVCRLGKGRRCEMGARARALGVRAGRARCGVRAVACALWRAR
eukprot:5850985-Prymnesium_polylepis.1